MTTTADELKLQLANTIAAERELQLKLNEVNYENRFAEEEMRGQRDPRTGRFIRHADYGADDQLIVTFSTQPVLNKLESYKAGAPKYTDMDFITIIIPGNKDLTYHGPVTDFYEWRFPNEFQAFKEGKTATVRGTPLSAWIEIPPSQVKELEFYGIKTVEQLANLSDSTSGVLRSFYSMKERAKLFLETNADAQKTSLLQMQLADQENKHKSEMDMLKAKLDSLMAMVESNNEKPAKAASTAKAKD